ncbi:MAG: replicative DNA helicase [Eubacteriales bacterium]|nr:replicative DNA helicase [Eubacteriales bacterium]
MEENLDIKKMPHSNEAESCVIGSMLQDNQTIVTATQLLSDNDFYSPQYKLLFNTILELEKEGMEADLVSLQDRLKAKQVAIELYSVDFLRSLVDIAIPENMKNYCKIVKEKSVLRSIIGVLNNSSIECYKQEELSDNILENTEKNIFEIHKQRLETQIVDINVIANNVLDRIEEASKTKGGIVGVESGFKYLDKTLSGFQKSNLIILAARTGMGKTSLALNFASNIAIKYNRPVAIFSLEMTKEEIFSRIISMNAIIDSKTLREGSLKDEEWSRLIQNMERLTKSKLTIDDTPSITIPELRAKCRQIKITKGLDMVIVDYLQLMRSGLKQLENRQQEVSQISRSLKALAKELNVPIMALAQVSRLSEQRDSKKPLLSDLRESGSIEQDADIVLFIHRDAYYNRNQKSNTSSDESSQEVDPKAAEIIIAKHRNGETGTINIRFEPSLTKFYDID